MRAATYAKAPAGYPNPFTDKSLGAKVKFDADLSEARYQLVNSLFDRIVTFRLKELNAAWKAIHAAEKKHEAMIAQQRKAGPQLASAPEALRLIAEARKLASAVPITEKEAADKSIAGSFRTVKKGEKVAGRQAEFEERWDSFASKNYAEAKALAEKAASAK